MQRQPRLFRLVRHTAASGVRGTGTLAEGVQWSDGTITLRWRGPSPHTSTWDDIQALQARHTADGRTQIHWFPSSPQPGGTTARRISPLWLPAPAPDGGCSRCGRPWPCPSLCTS